MKLTPVNVYCEDKGIRMEVEGISVHDNSAEIYISMQDLEGDRIDETIDLFDSYSIHTSCDQIGGCTRIAYDPAAKKATFLISVQQMDDSSIIGRKMTFSVSEFLSGKKEVNQKLSQIHLEDAMPAVETQTAVEIRGMSGMGMKESAENDVSGYLIADDAKSFSPADGVTVTNYGFIDNRLHIQTYYEDILKYDNHGYVYLKDSEGNIINSLRSISFWDKDRKGSFDEEIFDISPEADLSEYSVCGYFNTCKTKVQGDWKVTFPIENI